MINIKFNKKELNAILTDRVVADYTVSNRIDGTNGKPMKIDLDTIVYKDKSFVMIDESYRPVFKESDAITYIPPWHPRSVDLPTITGAIHISDCAQISTELRGKCKQIISASFYYKRAIISVEELLEKTICSSMYDGLRDRLLHDMMRGLKPGYNISR